MGYQRLQNTNYQQPCSYNRSGPPRQQERPNFGNFLAKARTIASEAITEPVGMRFIPQESRAISVSGHPLAVTGHARVEVAIGSVSVVTEMYFTDNSALKPGGKSYEVIVGCNVLKLLPPFRIDIKNDWFTMMDQKLPLHMSNRSLVPAAPVRSLGNLEIPPLPERFTPCTLDAHITASTKVFVVVEPSASLTSREEPLSHTSGAPVSSGARATSSGSSAPPHLRLRVLLFAIGMRFSSSSYSRALDGTGSGLSGQLID
ncbi:unnamed protein product [Gongylonema pulchrum]|uniref:DUF2169 domain-containing protein n=1 Tax=Gongylonema pulchrum TaxID=637853 RepID=A0A183ETK6_9BILA|nr:unnamed protein product [Gongylonema pulchrum]